MPTADLTDLPVRLEEVFKIARASPGDIIAVATNKWRTAHFIWRMAVGMLEKVKMGPKPFSDRRKEIRFPNAAVIRFLPTREHKSTEGYKHLFDFTGY